MGASETDELLVRRFKDGSSEAFEILVQRHGTRVYNLCLRILGDAEEAADASQDTFLAALRKLGSFRGDAAFTTWLHRVAVNACYDSLRRKRRRPLLQIAPDEGDERPEPSLPAPDHAEGVVLSVDVARALAQVPEEFRVVLVLADVQDLPYEEIAAVLEIPVGTVKSRVFRGRAALGRALGRGPRGTLRRVTDVRGRGMNHPYELLADLLDGTLDEGDLAGVQAHLDTCASCRRDMADATAGARAARSLPVEDPPADLHRRVVGSGGGRGAPVWYRWAGVAAAAAAIVAIAIALPNVGGDGAKEDAGGAVAADSSSSAELSAPTGDVVVSQENKDYDAAALEDLARSPSAERVSQLRMPRRPPAAAIRRRRPSGASRRPSMANRRGG